MAVRKDSDDEMILNDLHIETGDQVAVKNLLDDTIIEFFKEKKAYKLHYGWDNAKMILMGLAVVIAAASHFYKHPTVSEEVFVYSCVIGYFIIQGLLLGYVTFIEKDILVRMTRSKSNSGTAILVRTTFPYTDAHYTISIHPADAKGKQRKEELYIGRYFDKDGYFSKEAFTKDIEAVLLRFETKDKKQ
ncbi:uncharacterized protein CCR75_005609 [Bremia lactucae]|uniref:Signal peptidase complex subunit 2 n=1 Tax=Bremia lactucae TaxID=4779 RepID=A0A976II47_BRELC|nr:hypothetical protein CCR75_005609 [Bremia lactucae]